MTLWRAVSKALPLNTTSLRVIESGKDTASSTASASAEAASSTHTSGAVVGNSGSNVMLATLAMLVIGVGVCML